MPAAVAGGLFWIVPPLSGRPFTLCACLYPDPAALIRGRAFFVDLAYIGLFRLPKVAENRQRLRRLTTKTGQVVLAIHGPKEE